MNEICCFCGKSELIGVLIHFSVLVNRDGEEQQFACHKHCLVEKIIDYIPLHPDLIDNDELL